MLKRVAMLAGTAALLVGMAAPAAAVPVITELPMLPGSTQASAFDINEAGQSVGYSGDYAGNVHGVRWNADGSKTDLLPVPGDQNARALGINNAGVAVGASGSKAIRWNADGTIAILASVPGYDEALAFDINDAGAVVGNVYKLFSGQDLAVRWNPRRYLPYPHKASDVIRPAAEKLLPLRDDAYSWANDINEDGVVVGRSISAQYQDHAVKWGKDGVAVALPAVPGAFSSEARGINKQGVIVGYAQMDSTIATRVAVRWNLDGTVTNLGTLPGRPYGDAYNVNDNGLIVGRSEGANGYIPVQWTPNGSISELGMLPQDNDGQARASNTKGVIVGESGGIHSVRWN
ncbi:putative membrane protein [Kibdelosporangium banguiense]|uniref:Membrane protein n=1 Tax=Kibdelosporangium banguiense TaxID=1365924 RepID=A0ABS4U096_9PSEU|nr:DUF3466 family protein [Kibdelosporangium banguiense]MBP2330075.1 putative membrane protein [Kibdelosporangium banguiense]